MKEERQTYLEDLEFWTWITKGARFTAHERCLKQNKWSNFSIGMLSAYIIIINLLALFNISKCALFTPNVIGFVSTALSILILVFSQLENSNDFKVKAEKFHNSAREIAKVYRKIRDIKRLGLVGGQLESHLKEVTEEYQSILDRYDNHEEIDYKYYQATHPDDFPMSFSSRTLIRMIHYFSTVFIYHLLIVVPPAFFLWYWSKC